MDQRTNRLFDVLLVNACGVDYASTAVSPASLAERCHQGPCPLGVFQCPHGRACGSVTADDWAGFFGMDDEWDVCDGGNLKFEAMVKWLCRQLEARDAGRQSGKEPKTAEQWAVLAEMESQKEAAHATRRHAD